MISNVPSNLGFVWWFYDFWPSVHSTIQEPKAIIFLKKLITSTLSLLSGWVLHAGTPAHYSLSLDMRRGADHYSELHRSLLHLRADVCSKPSCLVLYLQTYTYIVLPRPYFIVYLSPLFSFLQATFACLQTAVRPEPELAAMLQAAPGSTTSRVGRWLPISCRNINLPHTS